MQITKSLLTAATITTFVAGAAMMSSTANAKDGFEKCEGIVAAGKNDCGANGHACSGKAKTDNAPGEWVYVPVGTCDKIAGGKVLKAKKK